MSDYEGTDTPDSGRILRLECVRMAVDLCKAALPEGKIDPPTIMLYAQEIHGFVVGLARQAKSSSTG